MAGKQKYIPFKDLILHEDEAIMVVNKPRHMASLDDKSNRNLHHLAKQHNPELMLCHRLDKMTSGCMILAKGKEHYRSIAMQFQHRKIRKYYQALVRGLHNFEHHVIEYALAVSTNRKVTIDNYEGKPSITIINTLQTFRNFSLLKCEPVTGRMHQIRIHLSAIRCPIVGDQMYGGTDLMLSEIKRNYKFSTRKEERPLNHDFLLHASSITFGHPVSGEEMTFSTELPKNFQVVLKSLKKYNAI